MDIILPLKGHVHTNGLKIFCYEPIAVKQFIGTPSFNDSLLILVCIFISYCWNTYFVASTMLSNFSFVVHICDPCQSKNVK